MFFFYKLLNKVSFCSEIFLFNLGYNLKIELGQSTRHNSFSAQKTQQAKFHFLLKSLIFVQKHFCYILNLNLWKNIKDFNKKLNWACWVCWAENNYANRLLDTVYDFLRDFWQNRKFIENSNYLQIYNCFLDNHTKYIITFLRRVFNYLWIYLILFQILKNIYKFNFKMSRKIDSKEDTFRKRVYDFFLKINLKVKYLCEPFYGQKVPRRTIYDILKRIEHPEKNTAFFMALWCRLTRLNVRVFKRVKRRLFFRRKK